MMLSGKGNQGLGKSDETDAECSVVDHGFDGVVVGKFLAVKPEGSHEQRELLLEGGLLEVEPFVELLCGNLKCPVEFLEEFMVSVFLVLDTHALDGKFHDIDGRE